ncbi:ketol-acid reductoisomerase [bacterium]|nr:ketol-acid reductoisomerase [bacterium]
MALESIQSRTVAILGYGNQGRAHALNLRDRGIRVLVGARPEGRAQQQARDDGFEVFGLEEAARQAEIVMLLLPDQLISSALTDLRPALEGQRKWIGFAHGFAFQFANVPQYAGCEYFLAAPKGAGSVLRAKFEQGSGLPTCFAIAPGASAETREIARAYAEAIAGKTSFIRETTFQWETEGDLFGEQVVLVGGITELMRSAFETLVRHGHPPELAFFDVCQEVRATVDLFLQQGPAQMLEKISPTALYGAATRGPRVIPEKAREEMNRIFEEVRSGAFAKELFEEFRKGAPVMKEAKRAAREGDWEKAYESVKDSV